MNTLSYIKIDCLLKAKPKIFRKTPIGTATAASYAAAAPPPPVALGSLCYRESEEMKVSYKRRNTRIESNS